MSSSSIYYSLKRESLDKMFFSSNSIVYKTIFSSTNYSLGWINFKVDRAWINYSFDIWVNFSSTEENDLWGIGLPFDDDALSWKILDLLGSLLGSDTVGIALAFGFNLVKFLTKGDDNDDALMELDILRYYFFGSIISPMESPSERFHSQILVSEF